MHAGHCLAGCRPGRRFQTLKLIATKVAAFMLAAGVTSGDISKCSCKYQRLDQSGPSAHEPLLLRAHVLVPGDEIPKLCSSGPQTPVPCPRNAAWWQGCGLMVETAWKAAGKLPQTYLDAQLTS